MHVREEQYGQNSDSGKLYRIKGLVSSIHTLPPDGREQERWGGGGGIESGII